jgi:hypothetical protein
MNTIQIINNDQPQVLSKDNGFVRSSARSGRAASSILGPEGPEYNGMTLYCPTTSSRTQSTRRTSFQTRFEPYSHDRTQVKNRGVFAFLRGCSLGGRRSYESVRRSALFWNGERSITTLKGEYAGEIGSISPHEKPLQLKWKRKQSSKQRERRNIGETLAKNDDAKRDINRRLELQTKHNFAETATRKGKMRNSVTLLTTILSNHRECHTKWRSHGITILNSKSHEMTLSSYSSIDIIDVTDELWQRQAPRNRH